VRERVAVLDQRSVHGVELVEPALQQQARPANLVAHVGEVLVLVLDRRVERPVEQGVGLGEAALERGDDALVEGGGELRHR
jgi:hypothetical protein